MVNGFSGLKFTPTQLASFEALVTGKSFYYGRRAYTLLPAHLKQTFLAGWFYSMKQYFATLEGADGLYPDISGWEPKTSTAAISGAEYWSILGKIYTDMFTVISFNGTNTAEGVWSTTPYAAAFIQAVQKLDDLYGIVDADGNSIGQALNHLFAQTIFGHTGTVASFSVLSPVMDPAEMTTFAEAGTSWAEYKGVIESDGDPYWNLDCKLSAFRGKMKPCLQVTPLQVEQVQFYHQTDK